MLTGIDPAVGGYPPAMDPDQEAPHPEQEHPVQDAHGGSMAPSLVDDIGRPAAEVPDTADPEAAPPADR
jgi:hypothetical protein